MKSVAVLLASLYVAVHSLDNGFGRTPVMGFNTYNDVACSPNQSYIENTMNAFASKGFLDLGYRLFQMDCGWQGYERQSNGSITYDASVFPGGIKPLSQLAVNLGFQWGMYTDQGIGACDTSSRLRPGSLGHEREDALQFAGWNVAYMKVDNCYITADQNAPKDSRTDFPARFGNWSAAQQSVGIKGLLICQWGVPYISPSGLEGPAEWTPLLSNSFRVSDDITSGWNSVMRIMNEAINVNLRNLSGPGHFADLDLLEVGNSGMTIDEQASHFAIWAMFKGALMVSTNVATISNATTSILSNERLIAINQDSLGEPVKLVQRFTYDYDLYAGSLANGDHAVLLLDQSNNSRILSLDLSHLGIASATVEDLWTKSSTVNATSYSGSVSAHGSTALRLSNIVTKATTVPRLTYIEAESGILSGAANIQSCSGCSGASKVGYIGNDSGNLELSGFRTSQATQDVRFDYINAEVGYLYAPAGQDNPTNTRTASISVNGGAAQAVSFPLSGYNWDEDVAESYLVRLSGFSTTETNTLKISGLGGGTTYAPDLDRIGVVA